MTSLRSIAALALAPLLAGCPVAEEPVGPPRCPPQREARAVAPGVLPAYRDPAFWLAKHGAGADAVRLSPAEIAALNRTNAARPWAFQDVTSGAVAEPARVARELGEREVWLQERLGDGRYVEQTPGAIAAAGQRVRSAAPVDQLRVIVADADLRCVPTRAVVLARPGDAGFDRNQCSGLHASELVRVLRRSADGAWWYVHAGHSVGWLRRPRLTPPLTAAEARAFRDAAPRAVVVGRSLPLGGRALRLGASLPLLGRDADGAWRVVVPTVAGLTPRRLPADAPLHAGFLPLTRANVLRLVLAQLDHRYGWGESAGGQDCSRLLLDAFAAFGLRLGRHSSEQARSAPRTVDLTGRDEPARLAAIRAALGQGIVVAYLPGHIMLMLGEDRGRPWGVSAIASYLRPCGGGGGAVVVGLDRVAVTDLELGRGTPKTSLLQRLTKLAIF